jgi:hypothetical protein
MHGGGTVIAHSATEIVIFSAKCATLTSLSVILVANITILIFFQWLEISCSVKDALLERRTIANNSLCMHIWLVNLAAESLVRRHSHAEIANLDVYELEKSENERQANQNHDGHRKVEHDRIIKPTQIAYSEFDQYIAQYVDARRRLACHHVLVERVVHAAPDPHEEHLGEHEDELDGLRKQVRHEYVVVVDADAVVDPGAMMVISFDALFADNAMSTATCTDDSAFRAQALSIKGLKQAQEFYALIFDVAGVARCQREVQGDGQDIKDKGHDKQYWIEADEQLEEFDYEDGNESDIVTYHVASLILWLLDSWLASEERVATFTVN